MSPRNLLLSLSVCGVAACQAAGGVPSADVSASLREQLAGRGLELSEVECPPGKLMGEFECSGKLADGSTVPIDVAIAQVEGAGPSMQAEPRDVLLGSKLEQTIRDVAREQYEIELGEVACPEATPVGQTATCEASFDGAAVIFEVGEALRIASGAVAGDSLVAGVVDMAKQNDIDLGDDPVDCGGKLIPTAPGREIVCKNPRLQVTWRVGEDGQELEVVDYELADDVDAG